jgi:ABC-type uncharacterized transport system substrate-binding protein
MDALITDYTALGVKAAGTIHRLLKGTREVNIVLINCERKQPFRDK